MNPFQILLVEDDTDLREAISVTLRVRNIAGSPSIRFGFFKTKAVAPLLQGSNNPVPKVKVQFSAPACKRRSDGFR